MKNAPTAARCILLASLLVSAAGSPGLTAQTTTVTYELEDVWLLPDITHPRESERQMTGSFEWTYTVGDFENGTGRFLDYSIPWWSANLPPLDATIEAGSIEFVMIGNYHDLGLDLTLHLAQPLSPDQPSPIDTVRSSFDIEVGVSRKGHVIRGRVVPKCTPPENYGTGSEGSGGFVPTITSSGGDPRIGNESFRVDCDQLLGDTGCLLLLGFDKFQFPFNGITILVEPTDWLVVSARASGAAGVPGVGTLQIPVPIPNRATLVGAEVDFQVLALDPGSPQGMLAATNGLTMAICQ